MILIKSLEKSFSMRKSSNDSIKSDIKENNGESENPV